MISEYIILFFLVLQLLYFLFLIVTNLTTTLFIVMSLRKIIDYFFSSVEIFSHKILNSNNYRPVSILVPAYNEEKTIIASVYSFLRLHFPEYEVIVINDGSTDTTMDLLIAEFELYINERPIKMQIEHEQIHAVYLSARYPALTVVDKANGGKSDALNCGINISRYPLFCSVDADTMLESDAIIKSIITFSEDRQVIAVGGKIGIMNGCTIENNKVVQKRIPKTYIEAYQVIEYARGFLAGRTAWDQMGALLIISGAFGIFRKDIVLKIDGYRHTIGEDFDLLIRMHRYSYDHKVAHTVRFIPETMCWTQAPNDYASLLKQRNRWHRGLLETLYHNKGMMFNPKYKKVGMLAMPYFLFIEALSPMITVLGLISIVIFYLFGLLNQDAIWIFFLLEFVWGALLNISSLSLEFFVKHRFVSLKDIYILLFYSFLEPFFYRPLLKVESFVATFNFFNTSWGEIKRKSI